ncbi:hypothetical protein QO034_04780 [Sedimentitalea sp. JM2-8]|uniref:Cholesterol transport system auxiliary component n=1 Tax=Sedimentitalea xiamensis TaxID=3050037 RepID=A0ABT7FBI0_9RHOB|nr:DUF6778 family protein [Sedimentitalea xiamensis]MDK3072420.1 hypothetical protein [Sedimentitalea xiamensis]
MTQYDDTETFGPMEASWTFRLTRNPLRLSRVAAMMLLPALVFLSACGGQFETEYGQPIDANVSQTWRVTAVNVTVPDSLTVSDENSFLPRADIVWHGDPPGDRRAQVQKIVAASAKTAVSGLRGNRPVALNMTVQAFHGVSPIALARAPEAVYAMAFLAQITDARTGTALTPLTHIQADTPALVGEAGINAAQFGPTQTEQVSSHIVATLQGWLGIGPDVSGSFTSLGR